MPEQQATAQPLRSALWIPAGAYGMGMVFAGGAGLITEDATRKKVRAPNVLPPLIALGLGLIGGAIPGALLGMEAREEDNGKARGAVGVLDVIGTAAVYFALSQTFNK